MNGPTIRITSTGALAGALSAVAEEAKDKGAWWRNSTLLAGTGLAYHLEQSGWTAVRFAELEAANAVIDAARALLASGGFDTFTPPADSASENLRSALERWDALP